MGNWRLIALVVALFAIMMIAAGCPEDQPVSEDSSEGSESEQAEDSESVDLDEDVDEESDENADDTGDVAANDEEDDSDSSESTAGQLYDSVEVGMTREQVEELAGRPPTMTNELETEALGEIVNLIYQSGPSTQPDVVTISLQGDEVKTVVLGEWTDGSINTKIKGIGR